MCRIYGALVIFCFLNNAKGNNVHQTKESISKNARILQNEKLPYSNEMPPNEISIPTTSNSLERIPNDQNQEKTKIHSENIMNSNMELNHFPQLTNNTLNNRNHTFRQENIHISEFTNPKTGLNPFLDLTEGTSNNTRNTSLTNRPKKVVHVIIPSKRTNKPKSEKDFKDITPERKTYSRFDPSIPTDFHNNWINNGKIHLDPVEGESGRRSYAPFEPIEEPASKRNNIFHLGPQNTPPLTEGISQRLPHLQISNKNPSIKNIQETSTILTTSEALHYPTTEINHNVSFIQTEIENIENHHSNQPNVSVTKIPPKKGTHLEFANLGPKIIPIITCVTVTVLAFLCVMHLCNKRSKRISHPNSSILYEVRKGKTDIYGHGEEPQLPLNEVIK